MPGLSPERRFLYVSPRIGEIIMPYELWHSAKQPQPSAQAFTFDGWSHEPLTLDKAADLQRPRIRPEPVTPDRKAARSTV